MRRLAERYRGPLADRPPVSTYEQAIMWLVREYDLLENPLDDNEPLPEAAVLVCDLFWVTERQLRISLKKEQSFYAGVIPNGPDRRRRPFARRAG